MGRWHVSNYSLMLFDMDQEYVSWRRSEGVRVPKRIQHRFVCKREIFPLISKTYLTRQ